MTDKTDPHEGFRVTLAKLVEWRNDEDRLAVGALINHLFQQVCELQADVADLQESTHSHTNKPNPDPYDLSQR